MTTSSRTMLAFITLAVAAVVWHVDAGLHASPQRRDKAADKTVDDRFAVHEWGTFTSMQGSTGVELDGMQHEDEALPAFVHSFAERLPSPFRDFGDHSANVPVRRTRSKMETPVIYFHSDRPRDVNVRVHFVRGLMSHYYPAPNRMAPAPPEKPAGAPMIDLSRLGLSFLEWNAHITPDPATAGIPAVSGDHFYGFAREVDAARVRVEVGGRTEDERFLFYRGLGHENPRLTVTSERGGKGRLENHEGEALPAAFAVEMGPRKGRFLALGAVDAVRDFDLGRIDFTAKDRVVEQLADQVLAVLVQQGLHRDEARAMVRTWAHQWFGSEGTRVLYVVPQKYVNRVLPLAITPTPDELVRVFVGRIEYLTPEEESRITADVLDSGAVDASVRTRAMHRLGRLGRFMEPKIRRVMARSRDRAVRDRAAAIIATIEAGLQRR